MNGHKRPCIRDSCPKVTKYTNIYFFRQGNSVPVLRGKNRGKWREEMALTELQKLISFPILRICLFCPIYCVEGKVVKDGSQGEEIESDI